MYEKSCPYKDLILGLSSLEPGSILTELSWPHPNQLNPNNTGMKHIQYFLVEKLTSVNMKKEFIPMYSTSSTIFALPATAVSHDIQAGIKKCVLSSYYCIQKSASTKDS
jgi:hypothetical protein